MKTITTTVYEFNELNDAAKEKARDWYRQGALNYEWWESTYEDAKSIGLEIESFDLDRDRHATGRFIWSEQEVADQIISDHGKDCNTLKTATEYIHDVLRLDASAPDFDEKLEDLNAEFLRSLLEDYSIMLQKEMEYQLSDEVIDESIIANEYTFTERGRRF